MSSTNKTESYSLNQWTLSDIPTMEDFNSDNETVDRVLSKHIEDSVIHLTEEEKQSVIRPIEMCTYHGDGKSTRDVELSFSFNPSLCLVLVVGAPLGIIDIPNQVHYNYFGIATKAGGSVGLTLSGKTLSVVQSTTLINKYEMRSYNELGRGYLVIGFR